MLTKKKSRYTNDKLDTQKIKEPKYTTTKKSVNDKGSQQERNNRNTQELKPINKMAIVSPYIKIITLNGSK